MSYITNGCSCFSIQFEDEEKRAVFTGNFDDQEILKFVQGEQLALVTKFSDEVRSLPHFSVSLPWILPIVCQFLGI